MTSVTINDRDVPPSLRPDVANFPMETRVILQDLLKASDLNGKKGVVRSILSSTGRYTVYIKELDKFIGIKPTNMQYEPIFLESLTVKQLKMVLKYKNEQLADISGIEKSDLQARLSKLLSSSDELSELLANANANSNSSTTSNTNASTNANTNDFISTTTSHSQAAEQLGNMSPDQLRQQAIMMRTMDPSTVRRMNPQLANMTESQIKMAADRMEMMANNPTMMKMAAEQMKSMDPAQFQNMQAKMTEDGNYNNNTASVDDSVSTPATHSANNPTLSVNQAQQAAKMMQNMNPEQLRHQAQMLKSTDANILRRTNPQLAYMSDVQIKMAANQFEMMASNPAMMKMAMDQMKNATPEQFEVMSKRETSTRRGLDSASGSNGMPSPSDVVQMGGDPTEILTNLDTTQLKEMLNTVKENPEMMKHFAGMVGISEDKLKNGVESFAGMDDSKIDAALKMMKIVQKAKVTWNQADTKAGGYLKTITIVMALSFVVWIVWYFFLTVQTGSTVDSNVLSESTAFSKDQYYATGDNLENEF